MWACFSLFSCRIVSPTMISCVKVEWITISGLSLVFLIILGCLSHFGRSAETAQASRTSSIHFFWFVVLVDFPCHDLAPPYAVNIIALVLGGGSLSFSHAYACSKFLKDSVMPFPSVPGDHIAVDDPSFCGQFEYARSLILRHSLS